MRLFELETNLKSDVLPVQDKKTFKKVADYYSLGAVRDIQQINKNNQNSKIFKVHTTSGKYIIRSIPLAEATVCEAQCEILSRSKSDFMLLPIKGESGFMTALDKNAFMCYRYIEGEIYDGKLDLLPDFLYNLIRFYSELTANEFSQFKEYLPKIHYEMRNDSSLISKLKNETFIKNSDGFLDPEIYTQFMVQETFIEKICRDFNNFNFNYQIVHYDVHHLNIIVNNRNLYLIDLEDVCLGDPRVAVASAIFKCLRHAVFVKEHTIEYCRTWLDDFLKHEIKIFPKPYQMDLTMIRQLCYFRNLADVVKIVDRVIFDKKTDYLYDMNKKMSNFLEIDILLGENGKVL